MPQITENLNDCVARLRAGQLVAMPTETVYGLAADARQDTAVQQVFALKGRPGNNPLIVHLENAAQATEWASVVPTAAKELMAACWPGPLTLVLPARDEVSRLVTAGQDSVALRVPAHPTARALLSAFGGALVAPSANRYMSISPTCAAHVAQQFAGSDLLILDGGSCQVGLESTIVSVLPGDRPRLLRTGMLGQSALEAVLGQPLADRDGGPRAPGQHHRHYAPTTTTLTFRETPTEALGSADSGWLWCTNAQPTHGPALDLGADPHVYAANLYAALYELDALDLRRLYIQLPPSDEAWAAVHDRLARASQRLN